MAVADKIIALLDAMTPASLEGMSPVRRRQFADLCRHWADIAEQPAAPAAKADVPECGRDTAIVPAADPPVGDTER